MYIGKSYGFLLFYIFLDSSTLERPLLPWRRNFAKGWWRTSTSPRLPHLSISYQPLKVNIGALLAHPVVELHLAVRRRLDNDLLRGSRRDLLMSHFQVNLALLVGPARGAFPLFFGLLRFTCSGLRVFSGSSGGFRLSIFFLLFIFCRRFLASIWI